MGLQSLRQGEQEVEAARQSLRLQHQSNQQLNQSIDENRKYRQAYQQAQEGLAQTQRQQQQHHLTLQDMDILEQEIINQQVQQSLSRERQVGPARSRYQQDMHREQSPKTHFSTLQYIHDLKLGRQTVQKDRSELTHYGRTYRDYSKERALNSHVPLQNDKWA